MSEKKWTEKEALEVFGKDIQELNTSEIENRCRLLENEISVFKNDKIRLMHDETTMKEKIKENNDKIKLNKQLPYLVASIVEVLELDDVDDDEEDGSTTDIDSQRKGKFVVIKTTTRQVLFILMKTIFLPVAGLVPIEELQPGELVGVNKDSYLILDKLPTE
jgi:26S proteasome regulatory subunit T5